MSTAPDNEPPADARRPRADARRNRARVLEAARQAVAEQGVNVPLDEIAARAGVGAGTVYRHFPTKQALLDAVVADGLERLVERARLALEAPDAGEAFFGFVTHLLDQARADQALKDALAAAGLDATVRAPAMLGRLRSALAALLEGAQRNGAVRDDLTPADLLDLLAAAAFAGARVAPGRPNRVRAVLLDGLRAGAGRPSGSAGPSATRSRDRR